MAKLAQINFQHKNVCRHVLLLLALSVSSTSVLADDSAFTEKQLLKGLQAMQVSDLDTALQQFEQLSEKYPNYKLANLLKADLLALKAGQKSLLDSVHSNYPRSVGRLKDEALVRMQFSQSVPQDGIGFDNYVLKTAAQSHLLLVNLAENRLYLYQRQDNGRLKKIIDYYISMGRNGIGKVREGDRRTPVGVYHVVDMLPGNDLPDLYGVGALPLNYPNKWDENLGRTGSGIWLHGTPSDTYIRAPKASRGCVVLNNNAMQRLLTDYQLPLATPVIIIENVNQLIAEKDNKQQVLDEVKAWLSDNQVSASWDSVSVYRYPNEDNLLYVTFPADVEGELVHQYWQRGDDGGWKLVIQSQEPIKAANSV